MSRDHTEREPDASLPPILTQATTTRTTWHSEPIPRSTSPIGIAPSSVSSVNPLHPIPTPSSSIERDDDGDDTGNSLPARPLPMLPNQSVPEDIRLSQPRMSRSITLEPRGSLAPRSGLDWIIPLDDKVWLENSSPLSHTHS